MALIVVDMGQRITTPVRAGKRKVAGTSSTVPGRQVSEDPDPAAAQAVSEYVLQQHTPEQNEKQQATYLKDIMTTDVMTLGQDAVIADAWDLFTHHSFHHLPVLNEHQQPVAILSVRDILLPPDGHSSIMKHNILDFASAPVYCFSRDTDIRQATRTLYEYDLGSLPVITEDNCLCGIVTRSDIIRTVSHYGPLELWA